MAARAKAANASAIYATIRAEIVAGELAPATPLREAALASRFGVSRTPIRDVLSRLLHDGLLERAVTGLQVATNSIERTIQVYDLRTLLEGQVAAEAADSRREADLMLLRRLLNRDRALDNPSTAERVRVNLEFHNAVWDAAHNGVLRDILERLAMNGVSAPQTTLDVGDRWAISLDQHAEMIDAIEDRDAERARHVAQKHLADARALRLKILTDDLNVESA